MSPCTTGASTGGDATQERFPSSPFGPGSHLPAVQMSLSARGDRGV